VEPGIIAAALGAALSRAIHKNALHGLGSGSKEVLAVVPVASSGQPQPRLMHQRGSL